MLRLYLQLTLIFGTIMVRSLGRSERLIGWATAPLLGLRILLMPPWAGWLPAGVARRLVLCNTSLSCERSASLTAYFLARIV